jgi:hypothetical protein
MGRSRGFSWGGRGAGWARQDSNLRPIGYEPTALPLSYGPGWRLGLDCSAWRCRKGCLPPRGAFAFRVAPGGPSRPAAIGHSAALCRRPAGGPHPTTRTRPPVCCPCGCTARGGILAANECESMQMGFAVIRIHSRRDPFITAVSRRPRQRGHSRGDGVRSQGVDGTSTAFDSRTTGRAPGAGSGETCENEFANRRPPRGPSAARGPRRHSAEVAEQADATVSKTVGQRCPCRFDPGLRHRPPMQHERRSPTGEAGHSDFVVCPSYCALRRGATVAQRTLDPLILVRIQAPQPHFRSIQAPLGARTLPVSALPRMNEGTTTAPN